MRILGRFSKTILVGAAACALMSCSGSEASAKHETKGAHTMQYEALGVPSGNYTMDTGHGYVTFSYLHKGLSNPQLRFNDVDAKLTLDADHPENSHIAVSIKAANIDSGVAKFDDHLNSADFFNTAENPDITFTSTSFTRTSATAGTMNGELTMMGVTKPLSFDVTLVGTADGNAPAIGVEGHGTLLRSDFALGKYVPFVGDEVTIAISAEFYKDK